MYTPECAGSGQNDICEKCGKGPTDKGHDGCLGTLPGNIMNACCGHGNDDQAYIQYCSGAGDWTEVRHITGPEAVAEQARLIKDRDWPNIDDTQGRPDDDCSVTDPRQHAWC